jgi:hypothetical protein
LLEELVMICCFHGLDYKGAAPTSEPDCVGCLDCPWTGRTTIRGMKGRHVIDGEELLRRYAAGERNFAGLPLEIDDGVPDADLSGIDLSGTNLGEVLMGESI